MHVLLAPDKFKGSLTAAEVADALAEGLAAGNPSWLITCAPVADGGDGTVAAAVAAGWMPVAVKTTGPTGRPMRPRMRCADRRPWWNSPRRSDW